MELRGARAFFLAGISTIGLIGSAGAADPSASSADSREARLKALEQEVQDLSAQIEDLKRSAASQYAEEQTEKATAPKVKIDNGRPTLSSGDGKFTASIRGLGQLDWAYYSQPKKPPSLPAAYGPDLSSGANFRRVYLGVQGK